MTAKTGTRFKIGKPVFDDVCSVCDKAADKTRNVWFNKGEFDHVTICPKCFWKMAAALKAATE